LVGYTQLMGERISAPGKFNGFLYAR